MLPVTPLGASGAGGQKLACRVLGTCYPEQQAVPSLFLLCPKKGAFPKSRHHPIFSGVLSQAHPLLSQEPLSGISKMKKGRMRERESNRGYWKHGLQYGDFSRHLATHNV